VVGWRQPGPELVWQFRLSRPGRYAVRVILGSGRHGQAPVAGHKVAASVGGQELVGLLAGEEKVQSPRAKYFPESASALGTVQIDDAGVQELALRALEINPDAPEGLTVAGVELTPVD